MLQKAARQSDALASQLPDTDPDKASIRARIARLGHECGCAAGGTFLVAATLLFVVYAALLGELDVRLVVLGAAFIFVSTMLGKLAGILTAVVRLEAPQVSRRILVSWKDATRAEEDRCEGQGEVCPAGVGALAGVSVVDGCG